MPGGLASYPSSVLMNCIPALVAGSKEIYMATPSMDNKYNPAVIYAAQKCKVKEIYKLEERKQSQQWPTVLKQLRKWIKS